MKGLEIGTYRLRYDSEFSHLAMLGISVALLFKHPTHIIYLCYEQFWLLKQFTQIM